MRKRSGKYFLENQFREKYFASFDYHKKIIEMWDNEQFKKKSLFLEGEVIFQFPQINNIF